MYLSVGEISKILGISTETIRHYVQEGIITPHKNTANNYWEYSSDDFIRLTDVLFYRSMGLSVKEIKTIMGGVPPRELYFTRRTHREFTSSVFCPGERGLDVLVGFLLLSSK